MDGWQHGTHDYDPETDGDEVAWARAVAADGWRTWHASGVWVTVGSRRVRRWAMRRPCARPWSAHDHAGTCVGVTSRASRGPEGALRLDLRAAKPTRPDMGAGMRA